jgi:hypothetical protein
LLLIHEHLKFTKRSHSRCLPPDKTQAWIADNLDRILIQSIGFVKF